MSTHSFVCYQTCECNINANLAKNGPWGKDMKHTRGVNRYNHINPFRQDFSTAV